MSRGLGVTQLAMLHKLSINPVEWSTIRQLDLASAHSVDDLRSKNAGVRRAARSLEERGLVEIQATASIIDCDVNPIEVRITDPGLTFLLDRGLVAPDPGQ